MLLNVLTLALLVLSAVFAFTVRRNLILCLAALIFVPIVPAALRYMVSTTVPGIAEPDPSTEYLVLGIICYGGVWGGFVSGMLFDWLYRVDENTARPVVGVRTGGD